VKYREVTAGEDAAFAIPAPASLQSGAPLFGMGSLPAAPYDAAYADGQWQLTIPGEVTAALTPGIAHWQFWIKAESGAATLVAKGAVCIMPSLLAGHDFRSYNRQVLDSLKVAMLRLAAEDEVEISIHNRTIKLADPEKIQKLIDIYQAKVNQELTGGAAIATIPLTLRRAR
jgi:hypothetical protein